jgi:hypothetical protein
MAAVLAAFPYPAWGAEVRIPVICDDTAILEAAAATQKATLAFAGMAGDNGRSLGNLYLSPDGEWAFMIRLPGGASCLVASGHDWREIDSPPVPVGDPS